MEEKMIQYKFRNPIEDCIIFIKWLSSHLHTKAKINKEVIHKK